MKTTALAIVLLAACTTDSNLGNTIAGQNRPDAARGLPPSEPDAAPPDANPPHNETVWLASQQVTPDQACDPWNADNTAATAPALANDELTLDAANGEHIAYSQSGSMLMPYPPTSPNDVYLDASVRLVDGTADYDFTFHGWTYGITIADGSVTTRTGTTLALPTTGAQHYYQFRMDPFTGWVIVTIDGNIVTEETAANAGVGAVDTVEFGQLAPGTSAWADVMHDIHATTDCRIQ